jgi:iron complex outermembrane receptor protein
MHADFLLDVDLIDRVEIIRGPGSSLYGNNALFGVVNIVTRRGEDFAGFETSGSYGSYDTYTGRLSYGNRFKNGVELMVSGTYFDSEGHETLHYSEFAHLNGGRVEGNDGLYGGSTFLALSYHGLSLEGGFAAREKRVPTAAWYSAFNDPRAMVFDQRAFASVKLDHQLGTDWLLSTRLYFDHYLYEGASAIPQLDYFDPLYPGLLTVNKDFAHADSIGTESQVSGTLFEHQRLTAGFEYRRDLNITQRNYDVQPHQTYVDVDMATDVFGVFLQDELTITRGLILNAGLRYDNFSSFGETVNPRAALIATPWSHTTVKAIYGQAYRAPNAYELYYEAPRYASNPRLHAETIQTYELALEQTLTTNVLLTASVFRNELEELITFEVDQTGENSRFGNLDHAHATGVETGFEAMTKGARLELSHTYVQTEDANGDPLTNAPEHLGKANLTIPLYAGKLFANFEFLAMSERRTVQDRQTAAHFLFNFTLFSRELLPGLQLSASIYNLLDESYSDPVGSDFLQDRLRQDGRTFRVKLTWNF